jgi:hypothetical protein
MLENSAGRVVFDQNEADLWPRSMARSGRLGEASLPTTGATERSGADGAEMLVARRVLAKRGQIG